MASNKYGYGWLTGDSAPSSGGFTSRWAKYAEEQRKRQAEADFQQQQKDQAAQQKQDNKNIFQKAGDLAGGLVNSVKDSWNHGVGDVARVVKGSVAANENLDLTNKRLEVQKQYSDKMNALFNGYENAKSIDELPKDRQDQWKKLADEQKKAVAEFDKQNNYQQREQQNNQTVAEAQKVDAKKTAFETASNFLDVATLGVGGLAKSGAKAGVEAGVKAAAKAGSKTAAERIAAKETTKAVADAVAKRGAQDLSRKLPGAVAEGAIINGVYGGVNAAANDQNVLEGAAQGAAVGGVLGGAGWGAGKLIRKAFNKGGTTADAAANATDQAARDAAQATDKPQVAGLLGDGQPTSKDIAAQIQDLQNGNYPQDLLNTTASKTKINDPNYAKDQKVLSDNYDKELKAIEKDPNLDATAKADAANKVNNKYEQLNNELDAKYSQSANAGAQTGEGSQTVVNKDKLKARFADLNQQYNDALAREANVARSAANERLANTPKVQDVQQEIQNYAAGNKPDHLYTPDQQPQDLLDVLHNPKLPQQLRDSADKVLQQANDARLNAPNFMDTATYESSKAKIVKDYNAEVKKLDAMPDSPYKQQKLDELTQQLDGDMQNLDGLYNDSAPARQYDQQINDFVNQKESQIVLDAQKIMDANPQHYRTLDPAADTAYQTELQNKLHEAQTAEFMKPTQTQGSVVATDELVHAADTAQTPQEFVDKLNTDPVTQKAADTVALDAATAVSGKQNPLSTSVVGRFLGIPREVLRSWGDAGKQFADKLDNAMFDYTSHRGQQILRIRQWDELLGKSDKARMKVFDALDSGDVSKLTDAEMTVYKDAREYFGEMADRLGIDPEGRISNYVPHLIKNQTGRDATALDQTIQMLKYGKDAKGNPLTPTVRRNLTAQLSGLDPATMRYLDLNTSYQFKNGFLEKRTGATNYQKNLMSVVNLYDTLGARKVYLEPTMQDIAKTVADKGNGFSAAQQRYVTDLFNNLRGTNKSELQTALDGMINRILPIPDASGKLLRGFRRLTNAGLMGGSVSTALKNTQAFVNIAAKINPKDLPHAIIAAGKSLRADSAEWRELYQAGVMDASFSNFIRDISHQGGTASQRAIDKAEVPLWTMMRNVDQLGRATAYFAKRDGYLAKIGKTLDNATPEELKAAMKAGRVGARDTSFEFTPLDIPVALDSDMGKLALQMQSWNLQQAQFIKNLFHGHEDSLFTNGKINAKGAYSLLGFLAGTAGFYYTVGTVTGMKPEDLVPFGSEFTQGQMPQSPIMNLLGIGGDPRNPGLYQIATANPSERGAIANKVGSKFLTNLIPGSAQFQRTVKGLDSTNQGVSRNASGKIQFVQNTDTASQLRAAVFGKYTTQAGHEWVTNGFPTLSDTQTATVDGLGSQEAKKKAAEFFIALNSVSGRQQALDSVKSAIKDGNMNKASRLAEEYNSKVRDGLRKYYADYQELPGVVGYDNNGNELSGSHYLDQKLINVSKYSE